MSNWSHSGIRTFLECPWHFKATYIDGYKGELISAFEIGKALHSMVHAYGEHCFAHNVGEDEAQARVIASTSDDPQVQRQFLAFAERYTWPEGLLGRQDELLETWHELDLGNEDLFRARIDLCRWADKDIGELEVTDFKSGGYHYPAEPPEAPIQLRLYALVMARELGQQVFSVHARIEYLGSGVVWGYDLIDRDFNETEEWLRSTIARIKRETSFLEEPGSHCGNCSCRSICPFGYHIPTETMLTEQIIEELDVLNAKREALAEALKHRVADDGEHTDKLGRTWGYHEGEECFTVPDPAKYAEARREGKLKPWAFCSWNQSVLRRDAKREPLRELLEEKGRERKWRAKRLGGEPEGEESNGAATPTREEDGG